jgi:hypothetical protein
MGGSFALVVVLFGVVAGVAALMLYRRRSVAAPKKTDGEHVAHKEAKAAQWGVRIAAPHKDKVCPQVKPILGKEFPLPDRPQLPVKGCPFTAHCECHYVKLFDRRKGERRSGKERREIKRFEQGTRDRRSGKDRRKNRDVDWV